MESFQVILDSGGAFPKENPFCQIGVSKNSGYLVKIMETPIKMDDLGGKPTIFGNIHVCCDFAFFFLLMCDMLKRKKFPQSLPKGCGLRRARRA